MQTLSTDSLGGAGQAMAPAMDLALAASFGSVALWRAQFLAQSEALGARPGWVVVAFLPSEGRLVNQCRLEDSPQAVEGEPILALEGAALADGAWEATLADIAWDKVYARYQQAVHAASEGLAAEPDQLDPAQCVVLDVRRAGVFQQARTMLPDARWCDPAQVQDWAGELPRDRDVLVYCVYGHEVGRSTAMKLRAAGVRARFLAGGIDAWTQAGRSVQAREPQA